MSQQIIAWAAPASGGGTVDGKADGLGSTSGAPRPKPIIHPPTGSLVVPPGSALAGQIRQVYQDVLGRVAENREVQVWMKNIQTGGWTLVRMRAAFTDDDQCKNAIVKVYTDTLDRSPLKWEIDAWRKNLKDGSSIERMREDFAHSDEGRKKIIGVYQTYLKRTPQEWEIATWQKNLTANGWTLTKMAADFRSKAH